MTDLGRVKCSFNRFTLFLLNVMVRVCLDLGVCLTM